MLNNITIMGRLTKNPELRTTGTGTKVASFSIACDRDFLDANGNRGVDFVDCVAWRATAEFLVRNFTKGMPILVSGRLQIRDYTDRDGNKRRAAEVIANDLYFAGGDRRTSAAPAAAPQFEDLDDDGELPWGDDDKLPI